MCSKLWFFGAALTIAAILHANSRLKWFFADPQVGPKDEVLFFPAYGMPSMDDPLCYKITVTGMVFSPIPRDGLKDRIITEVLTRLINSSSVPEPTVSRERAIMLERLRYFLVEHRRGRFLSIQVLNDTLEFSTPSGSNGHFGATFDLAVLNKVNLLSFEAVLTDGDSRHFQGSVRMIAPEGITIISDIDVSSEAFSFLAFLLT